MRRVGPPRQRRNHSMKQVLQNLRSGDTEIADVPAPGVKPGGLLLRTARTLVSSGTERMLVEFGRANLLDKARQQPDKVRQAIEKIKTDGLLPTLQAVQSKLDQPLAMGYCNVGTVIDVGVGVSGYSIGDRVASNGKHAEIVAVPVNLCARVPDAVSDESAAFTVVGAIALQGIRLAQPTLGETVVVTGLGLIGLIAVQLLRAQGCRVLGIDLDRAKLDLARRFGADVVDLSVGEDPINAAAALSRGRGVDAVIVTASTRSSEPIHQAAMMCRKRGRIVLVGVTGLELSRADFYEKELTFQVSCSYGPGRYDPLYEDKGQDYPIGFVRWTEQRNFEAVLDLMASGALNVEPLITHRFPIEEAAEAYAVIAGREPSLGVLLEYRQDTTRPSRTVRLAPGPSAGTGVRRSSRLAVIGAGGYGTQVLLPAFKAAGAELATVASGMGVTGYHAAKKFGAAEVTTDVAAIMARDDVAAVVIATRHDSHAHYTCEALAAGKSVFVEKPLVINASELNAVTAAYEQARMRDPGLALMVGFNRRFAPHVVKMKALLRSVREPKCMVMTINAGAVPMHHWTQDLETGGGRLIGEGCHFVDLLRYLADSPIDDFRVESMGASAGGSGSDNFTLTLRFKDRSIGTLHYFANGHKGLAKERIELFCGGRVVQIDNFRKMRGYGWVRFSKLDLWRQDKGQLACTAAFMQTLREGKVSPIPFDELAEVSRVCIEASALVSR